MLSCCAFTAMACRYRLRGALGSTLGGASFAFLLSHMSLRMVGYRCSPRTVGPSHSWFLSHLLTACGATAWWVVERTGGGSAGHAGRCSCEPSLWPACWWWRPSRPAGGAPRLHMQLVVSSHEIRSQPGRKGVRPCRGLVDWGLTGLISRSQTGMQAVQVCQVVDEDAARAKPPCA